MVGTVPWGRARPGVNPRDSNDPERAKPVSQAARLRLKRDRRV